MSRPPRTTPPPRRRKRNLRSHQEMDHLCKGAMERDNGRLLALIFTPDLCTQLGLSYAPLRLLEILPTEFRRKRQHADYLIKVDFGGAVVLLHIEFQNRLDPRMPLRIVQYQVAVVERYDLPVYSVVFNVWAPGQQAVQVRSLRRGALRSDWVEVTVPVAAREWGNVASPLAILLSTLMTALDDEQIAQCLGTLRSLGLSEDTCRELIEALCFLLDVRKRGPLDETRKRLFMKLRMEKTWLYQEGVEQGVEKGIEKGIEKGVVALHQAAIELCQRRFGAQPDDQGVAKIRQVHDLGLLSRLLVCLGTAATLSEALAALQAT